tara:strand:+ start:9770 stop:9973 length:204 start_codon:yes stop_codon:yes gene_type:complete
MNNKIKELIQERLELGAIKYGKPNMVSDGRDFVQEALEEVLDCCIYLCGKIIELKEEEESENKGMGA